MKFSEPKLLSGVVTQGSPDGSRWVKTFNLYYSVDGVNFIPYTLYPGETTPYLFTANTDGTSPVRNLLNREIIAQYLKIVPVDASPNGIGLRFDVLGCKPELPPPDLITPPPLILGPTPSPGTGPTPVPTVPPTISK